MRLAIPDFVSSSYFPAIAAAELGFFAREGLDLKVELMVPIETAFEAMRTGDLQFLGASAHLMVGGFAEWQGVKLLCAQSQGMYWFLVLRADLGAVPGDLSALRGCTIGAAPWVAMALRRLLADAGLDETRDAIRIGPIPGAHGAGSNFGVIAAQALKERRVDGFWANGMGAAIAVREGSGSILLDARRDKLPNPSSARCTMPVIAATDRFIADHPNAAAAAVRAMVATHRALRADISLATQVGRKLFPPLEAELLGDLIRRDLPFYRAAITPEAVAEMTRFSREVGILKGTPDYRDVVAAQFAGLWET
jgi:ABC-type nitrate/sulfonate/bicarbonate transport system substrate-binding protein